jgi:hypothetical protein
MTLYRYIPVWRRESHAVKLYRCFEMLDGRGYVVQSADYFYAKTYRESIPQSERQFLELLLEEFPEERITPKPSLEEAIQYFESCFV